MASKSHLIVTLISHLLWLAYGGRSGELQPIKYRDEYFGDVSGIIHSTMMRTFERDIQHLQCLPHPDTALGSNHFAVLVLDADMVTNPA